MVIDNKQLLEYDYPFKDVHFPFDPAYQVKLEDCESPFELRNERIAAHIAQKYNLIYRQGDGISTKTTELTDDLRAAHHEASLYMHVGTIHRLGSPFYMYYFTFDSSRHNYE